MDKKVEIGRRIRAARKAAEMTQRAVADHLKIERVNVTQWESGQSSPGRDRLPALAALLGVEIEWIIDGTGAGPAPDDRSFDRFVKTFPEDLKGEALAYLEYLVERSKTPKPRSSEPEASPAKSPATNRRSRS